MTRFVRPNHQHTASRVTSATTESGLMAGPPVPGAANAGTLVLRASGTPYEEADIDVTLQTGGGPTGYDGYGAKALWKNSTDSSSQYRGYVDTPVLSRVALPITYSATSDVPSAPKELPDGTMGIIVPDGATHTFYSISKSWVATGATIASITNTGKQDGFVVLPSGRLVAYIATSGSIIYAYYSDDYGATWAAYASSNHGVASVPALDRMVVEVVGDAVVMVLSESTGTSNSVVLVSTDAGATFAAVDTSVLSNGMTGCVSNGIVVVAERISTKMWVRQVAAGGGYSDAIDTAVSCYGVGAIVRRDDGVLWVFGWQPTAGGVMAMAAGYSTDGGLTWTTISKRVLDTEQTGYGASGYDTLAGCSWSGQVVVAAKVTSNGATDNAIHFLVFGGYETVSEGDPSAIRAYEHSYVAIDVPGNLGWTRVDVGAGATISYPNWLKIVGTAADNSRFVSSATWWTTATGATRHVRFRFRVNSGGSVANSGSSLRIAMDDGVNNQAARIRFSTTTARLVDYLDVTIGSDLTLDLTKWTDLLISFTHDQAPGTGRITILYRQDATQKYTVWQQFAAVPEEAASVVDLLSFGCNGVATVAVNWDIAYVGSTDDLSSDILATFTNPDDLVGRSLSSSVDCDLASGLHLGATYTGGVPGDTYTVATTYSRGKEQLWRDILPHRYVASSSVSVPWRVVVDAGASEKWDAQVIMVIANARYVDVEFNATDLWAAPSQSYRLSGVVWAGTSHADNTGLGYCGPQGSPGWRAGQYKSDGDAHRWFVEVPSGTVYEITDNDDSRVYVDGVDLSAEIGTVRIFSDRMALVVPRTNYRFASVHFPAQKTADGEYRLHSLVLDRPFDLSVLYEHGFVDGMEPNVVIAESDSGYRSTLRRGPRRLTLSAQWGPVDRHVDAFDLRLSDFFAALEGQPFAVWRDDRDPTAWGFYQYSGRVGLPNLFGEHEHNLGRVDQVILEEVW
jgi:hypothetical protein